MQKNKLKKQKKPILLQLYAKASAPCRDYYGLTVDKVNITLHIWKITHGPHRIPRAMICPLEEAPDDKILQEEVKNVFGNSICQYLVDLGKGNRRLENLPTKLFLHVLKFLDIRDVLNLAQTSKIFRELCAAELVWCLMFKKGLKRKPTPDEKMMAFDYGWKEVLKMRLLLIRKASQAKVKEIRPESALKKKTTAAAPLYQKKKASSVAPKRHMIRTK